MCKQGGGGGEWKQGEAVARGGRGAAVVARSGDGDGRNRGGHHRIWNRTHLGSSLGRIEAEAPLDGGWEAKGRRGRTPARVGDDRSQVRRCTAAVFRRGSVAARSARGGRDEGEARQGASGPGGPAAGLAGSAAWCGEVGTERTDVARWLASGGGEVTWQPLVGWSGVEGRGHVRWRRGKLGFRGLRMFFGRVTYK